ncbi:MAG: TrkA C-terminal domain-containing protein [Caldilineaceae bacterium]
MVEFTITSAALCVDKQVSDITWPRESVIASIRRNQRLLIPHGDTVLQAGDVIAVVADGEAHEEIQLLCVEEPWILSID